MTRLATLTALTLLLAVPLPAQEEPGPAPSDEALKEILEQELGADSYEPAGRRDPFVSLQRPVEAREKGARPRGPEGFLIQEVALKGIVQTPEGYVAMLLGPDNKSYFVRLGQRFYDGEVVAMDMATVTFRQDVTDPLSTVKTREVKKSLYPTEEARQ